MIRLRSKNVETLHEVGNHTEQFTYIQQMNLLNTTSLRIIIIQPFQTCRI